MIIANMGTYPARAGIIRDTLATLLPQVDRINLCLNNYTEIPSDLKNLRKLNCIIPNEDFRDVGKFVVDNYQDDDDVFYVDDDIEYPGNYVTRLIAYRKELKDIEPIIGLHAVIYPDVYDGSVGSRSVFTFFRNQAHHRVVNQLGTGTVYCKGYQAAPLHFMRGSQKYVDVRFARHASRNGWPMVSIKREANWLKEIKTDETIFNTFTASWSIEVIRECQEIAGYSKMDLKCVERVERSSASYKNQV